MLDASHTQLAECLATVQKVGNACLRAFGADGITVQQFNEAAGGQEVFHLHYHILPRHEGDKLRPPGVQGDMDRIREQADAIAAALGTG